MTYRLTALVLGTALIGAGGAAPEAQNMRLVGYNDLQARSAYQPTIVQQDTRWIAYVGHHGGTDKNPKPINPLTGQAEFNGTSIVDVSDPRAPRYLAHIPGAEGTYESGGAQMVRYFGYGTNAGGIMQIVDRQKLLSGPKDPTPGNLAYPEVGRLVMPPMYGAHTTFPILGVPLANFAHDTAGAVRDFVVITDEELVNECREAQQMV